MEVERTELDCLLENVDEVPIMDVQMDAPEAAATPEEEERDQLLLVIGKHIRMYRAQRALYQQKVGEAIEDAKGGGWL